MVEILAVGAQDVIVADPAVREVYRLIEAHLAHAPISVLVHGETGVGKELVAAALHWWSPRSEGPFVAVNCAALPDTLVESTLFGHRRGAFTGADADQQGLVRAADGGTLFLDEVGEMSDHLQTRLLRVLEGRCVRPVGATEEISVDVRIVAATNRSLRTEVRNKKFRKDLYFRLRGACLTIPPLRQRPLDIEALTEKFILDACIRAGRRPKKLSDGFMSVVRTYRWPGNVRELESAMNFLGIVVEDEVLHADHFISWCDVSSDLFTDALPTGISVTGSFKPIAEEIESLERDRMRRALAATSGQRNEAAALIGMPLRTFSTKLKQYQLDRVRFPATGRE